MDCHRNSHIIFPRAFGTFTAPAGRHTIKWGVRALNDMGVEHGTATNVIAVSANGDSPTGHGERDEFEFRPLYAPLAAALIIGTAYSFIPGLGLLCFGVGSLTAVVWLGTMLFRIVRAARRRLWRRALSLLAILVGIWPLMGAAFLAGDYVHLGLAYPYYATKLETTPDGQSKPLSFSWGGKGFAGAGNMDRTLLYDPGGKRAMEFRLQETPPELPGSQLIVRHLIGHFYLVEFSW